jgi:hypothetical protein
MPEVSVYLVNCLASTDSRLWVGKQELDEAQRTIRFDYSFLGERVDHADPWWRSKWTFWLTMVAISLAARAALHRPKV